MDKESGGAWGEVVREVEEEKKEQGGERQRREEASRGIRAREETIPGGFFGDAQSLVAQWRVNFYPKWILIADVEATFSPWLTAQSVRSSRIYTIISLTPGSA